MALQIYQVCVSVSVPMEILMYIVHSPPLNLSHCTFNSDLHAVLKMSTLARLC